MRHLIALLLLTAGSGLAYSPVQVGPNTCKFGTGSLITTTLTCTFPSPVTAGNRIVVGVHSRLNAATGITTITDSLGKPTTFTLKKTKRDSNSFIGVWLYIGTAAIGGSDTISVTLNGNYYYGWLSVAEYRAEDITETDAGTTDGTGTNTTHNCSAVTPGQDGTQIIAATYNSQASGTTIADSPFTARVTMNDGSAKQGMLMDYFQATAASVVAADHNGTGSIIFVCVAAAFTSPAPPASRRRQPLQSSGVGWAPTVAASLDWSLVVYPDQHPLADGSPWRSNVNYALSKLTEWNIKAFAFVGDILAYGETMAGFGTHGLNDLLATGLPTISAHGNHDCEGQDCSARATSSFDDNVGYAKVAGKAYGPVTAFSGVGADVGLYADATYGSKANYAARFAVNGHKFLVVALELFPRTGVMTWAANLAAYYPDHKVIWLTHAYIEDNVGAPCTTSTVYCAGQGAGYNAATYSVNGDGAPPWVTGQYLYDNLIKLQANSFLSFNGHFPDYTPHYKCYSSTGTNGNAINAFFFDWQALRLTTGNDAVMRVAFHEVAQTYDVLIMKAGTETVYASWLGIVWAQ
jgi:hypothetical protein